MDNLNVEQYIDENKISRLQWLVFIAGILIIFMDGLDTGVIGFAAPSLIQDWGIEKSALAPALSASLVGMSLGAMASGTFADKFGRKWVIVISTLLFGFFTIVAAFSKGIGDLTIYRFMTGVGLGAAMPNIATLVAEYMPKKHRAKMVNFICCAFPLGITMGGVLASIILPISGWEQMFLLCGTLPVIIGLVLIFSLPDSVQSLLNRNKQEKAKHIMLKMTNDESINSKNLVLPKVEQQSQNGLKLILSPQYRFGTYMLWLCCFMSLLVFYLLTSWMPVMLKQVGFSIEQYSLLAAVFPFGGVFGAIIIGYCMDKFHPNKTLMTAYFVSVVLFAITGLVGSNFILLGISIFLSGAGLVGAQSSLLALTSLNYPVQGRATGTSWMHGIGRTGAILGALFGASILSFNLGLPGLMVLLAVPVLISATALLLKGRSQSQTSTANLSVI